MWPLRSLHYTTYVPRVWCKKDQQTSEEKSLNDLQRFSKVLEKHSAAKICAHILEISRVRLRNGHIVVPDQISIRPEAENENIARKVILLMKFMFIGPVFLFSLGSIETGPMGSYANSQEVEK